MSQSIYVKRNREFLFLINSEVFQLLFNNTVVHRLKKYQNSLLNNEIQFSDFIDLSRKGEVPYPIFFLERQYIDKIIQDYNKRVFFGVSKELLSISSRGDFELADISLILKDITRKQNFIKKAITSENVLSGRFAKPQKSIEEQATEIRELIGYDFGKVFKLNKKETFNLIDSGLSNQNVYISLYSHNYSPQYILKNLQFSGVAINDRKCPFIFVKAGDNSNRIEPWGRRLFTVALLLSCLLHGDCRPVTMDGFSRDLASNEHYTFAEELLMPACIFQEEPCSSYENIKTISNRYSVSPSATVMRLFRLNRITSQVKDQYLDLIFEEWNKIAAKKVPPKPISQPLGIARYNNRTVVKYILNKYDTKEIGAPEARNLLCYKKGENVDLEALRNV